MGAKMVGKWIREGNPTGFFGFEDNSEDKDDGGVVADDDAKFEIEGRIDFEPAVVVEFVDEVEGEES